MDVEEKTGQLCVKRDEDGREGKEGDALVVGRKHTFAFLVEAD